MSQPERYRRDEPGALAGILMLAAVILGPFAVVFGLLFVGTLAIRCAG